jgi:hypothetical protein
MDFSILKADSPCFMVQYYTDIFDSDSCSAAF